MKFKNFDKILTKGIKFFSDCGAKVAPFFTPKRKMVIIGGFLFLFCIGIYIYQKYNNTNLDMPEMIEEYQTIPTEEYEEAEFIDESNTLRLNLLIDELAKNDLSISDCLKLGYEDDNFIIPSFIVVEIYSENAPIYYYYGSDRTWANYKVIYNFRSTMKKMLYANWNVEYLSHPFDAYNPYVSCEESFLIYDLYALYKKSHEDFNYAIVYFNDQENGYKLSPDSINWDDIGSKVLAFDKKSNNFLDLSEYYESTKNANQNYIENDELSEDELSEDDYSEIEEYSDLEEHIHSWSEDTKNLCIRTCDTCGENVENDEGEHTWVYNDDYSERTCDVCAISEPYVCTHNYSNENAICSLCGNSFLWTLYWDEVSNYVNIDDIYFSSSDANGATITVDITFTGVSSDIKYPHTYILARVNSDGRYVKGIDYNGIDPYSEGQYTIDIGYLSYESIYRLDSLEIIY